MAWFIGQSLFVIVLAFVLGVIVGWLWWRRRKVHFGESQAVAAVTAKQKARMEEQAAELTRRESELRASAAELRSKDAALAAKDDEIARLTAVTSAARTAPPATATAEAEPGPGPAETVGDVGAKGGGEVRPLAGPAAAEPAPAEPAAAEGDDLERIEGIGPRIGTALREAGIRTFRQLADADTTALQAALEHAGLRFAPSLPTWSRQARLLAEGDEAGFQTLTQQLVGGRNLTGGN